MEGGEIFLDLFIGLIGMSYLIYAKKQSHPVALISGTGLSLLPFFVSNLWGTLLGAGLFIALPFVFEL